MHPSTEQNRQGLTFCLLNTRKTQENTDPHQNLIRGHESTNFYLLNFVFQRYLSTTAMAFRFTRCDLKVGRLWLRVN